MSKPSRMEILELLSNGKITAAEAATLLSDVEKPAKPAAPPPPAAKAPKPDAPEPVLERADSGSGPNWFRVRVADLETGKNRVAVNIPVRMMKFGLKIGKRFSPEIDNIDWNELTGMMQEMKTGMLVDVQDADSNEHVQVYFD